MGRGEEGAVTYVAGVGGERQHERLTVTGGANVYAPTTITVYFSKELETCYCFVLSAEEKYQPLLRR